MYIIKDHDCFFVSTFEVGGTIIMTNFSNVKEDAKVFDNFEDAIQTLNRIKHQTAIIEEI